MRVVPLTDGQIEELRQLDLDVTDFERRLRSARTAREELLRKAAGTKGADDSWRLSEDGKFIVTGGPSGQWERG